MRAYAVPRFKETPTILTLPDPTPPDGVVVRVTHAGVNPVDYKRLDALGADAPYPVVVGQDFAGVVVAVPADEHDLKPGDRLFGIARSHGAYAEMTAIPPHVHAEPIARIPDGLGDAEAAGLPTPALTALAALEVLGVRDGTRLLVLGAAGAVGGYALQMARARGAHVAGTVRGDTEDARELGAQEVYDATNADPRPAIRDAHPNGFDAILDLVSSKDQILADADLLRPGGHVVSTIGAANPDGFDARGMHATNLVMAETPQSSRAGLETVAKMVVDRTLTVRISEDLELADAAVVLHDVRTGGISGKAILHRR